MKSLLLLLLFIPLFSNGQELSELAQLQKEKHPERYSLIKEFAQDKWPNDYSMQVYEVNKQTQSMCNMANKFMKSYYIQDSIFDFSIFSTAILKWEQRKDDSYNTTIFDDCSKIAKLLRIYVDSISEINPPIHIVTQTKFMLYVEALTYCIYLFKTDWSMVEYEYNKQLAAKEQL